MGGRAGLRSRLEAPAPLSPHDDERGRRRLDIHLWAPSPPFFFLLLLLLSCILALVARGYCRAAVERGIIAKWPLFRRVVASALVICLSPSITPAFTGDCDGVRGEVCSAGVCLSRALSIKTRVWKNKKKDVAARLVRARFSLKEGVSAGRERAGKI